MKGDTLNIKKLKPLKCEQPDRDVPKLKCGYPLPCPWHTVVLDIAGESITIPATNADRMFPKSMQRIREILHAFKPDLDPELAKVQAYEAGFDCGRNGATPANCSPRHFGSIELRDEWQRGAAAGEKEKNGKGRQARRDGTVPRRKTQPAGRRGTAVRRRA